MRWEDERYVRLYTRDTGEWILLGWEAQAVLTLAMRKCDRAGILRTGANHARGLAAMTGIPVDVVTRALPFLLEGDGPPMLANGPQLVIRNFIEAQEARASDAMRAKKYRERARDIATGKDVTTCDVGVTSRDATVTDSHTPSHAVTPSLAVPSLARSDRQLRRRTAASVEYPPGFLKFWQAYPKKVAKGDALKAWPGDELAEVILRAVTWQAAAWKEPRFIKHPATWLRARCWEDEPPQGPRPPAPRQAQLLPEVAPKTSPESRGFAQATASLVAALAAEKGAS
jgi:hypothetical protein